MTQKHYITWDEFTQDVISLIEKVKPRQFKGMVVITRGGLAPAAIFSNHYPITNIEIFSVSSYDGFDRKEIRATTVPVQALKDLGEGWIVLDELSDTGSTIKYIRELLPHAFVATVYAKTTGTKFTDAYVREFQHGQWLVFPWEPDEA